MSTGRSPRPEEPAGLRAGREPHAPLDLEAVPPPWDYNPSAWSQRIPVGVLALVAAGIAFYMSAFQWGAIATVFDPVFGEQTASVLTSDVAERMHRWFLVPDAALGALAYLGDAIFAVAGSTRRWQYRPWLVILFGIDVIPLGAVSIVLVVLQGTVVGSWCLLCLVTAAISMVLIVLAFDEVLSCVLYLRAVYRETGSARIVWRTFWGRPSPEAAAVAESFLRERGERRQRRRRPAPRETATDAVHAPPFPWARACEVLIGGWLIASPIVFDHPADSVARLNDSICGGLIVLFAVGSMLAFDRLHYLSLAVLGWMLGFAYLTGTHPAPAALQNDVLVAFLLLMFVVLPTNNLDPPPEWQQPVRGDLTPATTSRGSLRTAGERR